MNIKALNMEAYRQKELYDQIVKDGGTLAEDPANLENLVGQIVSVDVYCQEFTESLLAKLYVSGTQHLDHAFMLIPVWQIVKYNQIIPEPGKLFTGTFIVGVRRILSDNTYVFTLRLPRS
jgi:hypothetical protein